MYSELGSALRALPRVPSDGGRAVDRAVTGASAARKGLPARAVPLPDLLVAAGAESAGLTVLHYDADFERISALTNQPVQWVVPRGSVA